MKNSYVAIANLDLIRDCLPKRQKTKEALNSIQLYAPRLLNGAESNFKIEITPASPTPPC